MFIPFWAVVLICLFIPGVLDLLLSLIVLTGIFAIFGSIAVGAFYLLTCGGL